MASLEISEGDGLVTYILNRPERLNALSAALARELMARIVADGQRDDVRAMIIMGAGTRAFCSGTDLKEREAFTPEMMDEQRLDAWNLNLAVWNSPKPTFAAIRGWCLGGGFELALFCDVRIASRDAVFGFPEFGRGSFPGAGGPMLLSSLVGYAPAADILLTSRQWTADDLYRLGLLSQVTEPEMVRSATVSAASGICKAKPEAVAAAKLLMRKGAGISPEAFAQLNDQLHLGVRRGHDWASLAATAKEDS